MSIGMHQQPSDQPINVKDNESLEEVIQRLKMELCRKGEEQRAILQIHRAASAHLENDELLEAIATAANLVVPFSCMAVVLSGLDDKDLLVYTVAMKEAQAACHPGTLVPSKGTVTAWVLEHKQLFVAQELDDLRPFPFCHGECAKAGIESHCALPLIIRDRAMGVLIFVGKEKNLYSKTLVPFLEEAAAAVTIALDNCLAYQGRARLKDQLAISRITTEKIFEGIVGQSQAIKDVVRRIVMVAHTDSSVLISGETGTGKELVARAIFHLSRRSERPLITINCATLPAGLIESELFGHEKGAFTGAVVKKAGRFELADGGTIFLDEIGDLPPELQAKLLRVLQDGEFERVGGTRTLKVDVRVVAATNQHLYQAAAYNGFRSDLYYRLNVFPVHMPPLRERSEDVPPLAEYLLEKYASRLNKPVHTIDGDTMQRLVAYSWPGNVRELENVIERAVIVSKGLVLELEDDLSPTPTTRYPSSSLKKEGRSEEAAPEYEGELLLNSLELAGGNHSKAARLLGIGRTTLWRKLKIHGLSAFLVLAIPEDLFFLIVSTV
jgi:formate hydrogenlyase transcriptional activator